MDRLRVSPRYRADICSSNNNNVIKLHKPLLRGPAHAKKLMEGGLLHLGVRLYNALPEDLRAIPTATDKGEPPNVDGFKTALDKFLWLIPDEPGQAICLFSVVLTSLRIYFSYHV